MGAKTPGRPTKLTDERADRLVELLASGATITESASALGVSRRTVQHWRSRAWSQCPADAAYVALERRLQAARLHREREPTFESWEEIARDLERQHPARWAPHDRLPPAA